jgi:hypothetical protein
MGPGARPIPQGDGSGPVSQRDRTRKSRLQEVIAIRESYSVDPTPSNVTISYMLNNRQRSFTLEYASMPLSGFSSQVLFGGPGRATTTGTFIIDTIRGVENVTGTQLTQQQAEGFAKHATKRMLWSYMGIGSAVGAAAFLWQHGRHNMKFPLMKAKDLERYNNFPNRYLPILKGQYARIMWQITRFNVYAMVGIVGLTPIFGSVGDTSMTVGLYKDDRTRHVLEKVKGTVEGLQRIGGNLPSAAGTPTEQSPADDYGSQEAYSSSSESYGGESDVAYYDGMDNTGDASASARPSPSQMRPQVPQQRPSRWGQRSQQSQPSQTDSSYNDSSQDSDPFEFNADPLDAARSDPNSPQYDPSASASQPQQKPRQRSWASIRNEARQGSGTAREAPPASPYPSAQDAGYPGALTPGPGMGARSGVAAGRGQQGSGESFSYGAEEADKQYAKEQAQKEFDAMLERERRLGEQGGDGAWGRGRRSG